MTDPDNAPPSGQAQPESLVPAMEGFAISQRDRIDRSMDTSELTLKDKSIRATRQGVLDDRTDAVLRDLIRLDYVTEVHGVVSTGKEANVYGAVLLGRDDAPPTYRALKIYKTRILAFKDRERYIEGEYRFQKGATKGYAMVQLWAQKEFRNLSRLRQAGIPCPEPIVLRGHTILMEFLGRKGISYPKLVDVVLGGDDADDQWRRLYVQLLGYMRRMYHVCRLVHADLSEYNILYHAGKLYIIDVSQSVEPDHPRSLEFLRMDIKNVGDYFRRQGVDTLPDRMVFNFITTPEGPVEEPALGEAIEKLYVARPAVTEEEAAEVEVDNEVFRNQYIPQTLEQVYDIEKDAQKVGQGQGNDLIYSNLLADQAIAPKKAAEEDAEGESEDDSDSGEGAALSSEGSDDEGLFEKGRPRGRKFEDKDEKRVSCLAPPHPPSKCSRLANQDSSNISKPSRRPSARSARRRFPSTSRRRLSAQPHERRSRGRAKQKGKIKKQ